MIELKNSSSESQDSIAGPDRSWTMMRDRVREMIRSEVGKLNPTEDARYPLELIVESSVRYTETDGEMVITVVDEAGCPRSKTENGQAVPFTIQDLAEELRRTRPMLFKPDPAPRMSPAQAPATDAAPLSAAEAPATEVKPPRRDWLDVGSGDRRAAEGDSGTLPGRHLRRLRRGRVRLHLWSRSALKGWIRPAAAAGASRLHAVRSDLPHAFDHARGLLGRARTSWSARPRGFALGAVAAAALLAIGGLVLSGRDSATGNGSAEPSATGTVSASRAPSLPLPTSSQSRTLRGVPDVLDTATLSLEGEVVRLFGVEWAPGGGKPDDLTQYLRAREVVCEPTGANDTYRCEVGGQDLSRVVLFNGGGKATAEATDDLKAAAEKARAAKIGVWSQ